MQHKVIKQDNLICPHCKNDKKCNHKLFDGQYKKEKYTIKVEALVPAIITYDIELEDPENVDIKTLHFSRPKHIQYIQPKTIYSKITIYKYLSSIIRFIFKLK